MITFAALAPHNPLLLTPDAETEQTHDALVALSAVLAHAESDVIVIITEHAPHIEDAFSITVSPTINTSFKSFGIVKTEEFNIDIPLSAAIAHALRAHGFTAQQLHGETLDYGSGMIAHLLQIEKPIVVIGTSRNEPDSHAACGEIIQDVLQRSNKKIAVIVGGDCSHKHSVATPAGFSEHAELFDAEFKSLLGERSITALTQLHKKYDDVDQCVTRSAALGFGIIKNFPTDTHILAHETAHGVGFITALLFTP